MVTFDIAKITTNRPIDDTHQFIYFSLELISIESLIKNTWSTKYVHLYKPTNYSQ